MFGRAASRGRGRRRLRAAPARRRARRPDRRARQLRAAAARRLRDRRRGPARSRSNSCPSLYNGEMRPVLLPMQDLGAYLPYRRVSFGQETVELGPAGAELARSFLGLVSIKDYPGQTAPGMLDELLRLPFELTVSQSFGFVERQAALGRMNLALRRMRSAEDEAVSLRAELSSAKDEVAAGRAGFGEHHMTIAVRGDTPGAVDDGVAEAQAALGRPRHHRGARGDRAGARLLGAVPRQLQIYRPARPGLDRQFRRASPAATTSRSARPRAIIGARRSPCSRRPRPGPIISTSTRATSAISPSSGRRARARRWCSTSCSPRRASSGRGSSSSTRTAAPSCSSARSAGATTCSAPGVPSGLNPLQLRTLPANRQFLIDWLALLAGGADIDEVGADQGRGRRQFRAAGRAPPAALSRRAVPRRRAGRTRGDLWSRLRPWWGEGERAWLFDNERDRTDLSAESVGFDMTPILDDPAMRTPAMMYLFHRVEERLDGSAAIIVVDEGWKALDDDVFVRRIKDWEKTIRKRNGIVGFATQSAQDALESRIASAIIEQAATQIFMANPEGARRRLYRGLRPHPARVRAGPHPARQRPLLPDQARRRERRRAAQPDRRAATC